MCNRIINYSLPCFVYINVNYLDYVDEDHVIDFEKIQKKIKRRYNMWRLWRIPWMWRISISSVTQMKLFLFHTNFNFYKMIP